MTIDGPSLLQRIARGDQFAVRESIDVYSPLVWSLARRLCADRTDAEDAVQEIFIDLWKSAPRFDPGIAAEATFVAMIARRRLIDRLRRLGRRASMASLSGGESGQIDVADGKSGSDAGAPGAPGALAEDAGRALRAMEALSEEQQSVLRLSIMQGRSHAEIAEITGMPLGTVKTHARRGLIRIRAALEESKSPARDPNVGGGA